MGRQKGLSQRTKGNVQPSSSRRAASMLTENQRFVGFDAMSGELGYVPMLKSLENDKEAIIDPDFRVSLSKLTKKDATTKIKALAELTELCETKVENDTIAILPYWPRLYNKLCDDSDRKVRELCQVAFASMIKSVGKNIAPHLKGLMGWWCIAQSDPHAPAMSAAVNAFAVAFPTPEKQRKALIFCYQEIFQCLTANIFFNTKLQISSSAVNDARDNDRKISSSLNALAAFIKTLNAENIKNIPIHMLQDVYLNPKLWKFSKHQNPSIRSAFYSLLSSYCCHTPDIVNIHLAATAKTILHKLDESNPVVSKSIWLAENSFTSSFPQWHENIDIRKGFLPQLWTLIKSGFHGNAKSISSFLAPLVSRFPPSLAVSPVYIELLNCLSVSLSAETVLRSSIETKAVLAATFECMKVILQNLLDVSSQWDFELVDLVWNQHAMSLLEKSITPESLSVVCHKLFAQFLNSWFSFSETAENKNNFHQVNSIIWKDLTALGKDLVVQAHDSNTFQSKFLNYINFLNAIQNLVLELDKKPKASFHKVHFGEIDPVEKYSETATLSKTNSLLQNHLERCVLSCVDQCLTLSCASHARLLILSKILKFFNSVSLIKGITKTKEENIDPAFTFFKDSLFPIAKTASFENCTKEQSREIANLFYCIVKQIRFDITTGFIQVFNELLLCGEWSSVFFTLSVIEDQKLLSTLSDFEWLTKYIYKLVEEFQDTDMLESSEKWNVVWLALSHETLLKPQTVVSVLDIMNSGSLKHTAKNLMQINRLLAVCFCNHCSSLDLVQTKATFQNALFPLLEQISGDHQKELLLCLKQTVNSLLTACCDSNDVSLTNFAQDICCSCAAYLSDLLFKRKFDFDGFKQAMVLVAEELVLHRFDHNAMSKWLDNVLPLDPQFSKLRPSIDSKVWLECQSVHNKLGLTESPQLINEKYFLSVKTYLDLATCVFSIVTKNNSDDYLYFHFQTIFFESLFAKAIATTDWIDFFEIQPFLHQHPQVLSELIDHSLKSGFGWITILAQYVLWVTNDNWSEDVFMKLLKNDISAFSSAHFEVLIIFCRKSNSVVHLKTMLSWFMQSFLKNHFSFVESNDFDKLNPGILSVLVALLQRISMLQENKPIYIEDDIIPVHIQVIEKLMQWKSSYVDLFLFDADFAQANSNLLKLNSAVVKFLQFLVDACPFALTADNWDFIECSFVSWMESCSQTYRNVENKLSLANNTMLYNVCILMTSLDNFITSPDAFSDPTLPPSLSSEWGEFFKPAAHSSLIQIYKALSIIEAVPEQLLQVIDKCLSSISSSSLISAASALDVHLLPGSNLSQNIQTLLYHFGTLFLPKSSSNISIHQSISYMLLDKLVVNIFSDVSPETCIEPPLQLLKFLDKLVPEVVESIDLLRFKSTLKAKQRRSRDSDDDENHASSPENSDNEEENDIVEEISVDLLSENSYLYSFLLIWKLLVAIINYVPPKGKAQYVAALSRNPLTAITELLSKLKILLPGTPYYFFPNNQSQSKISFFKDRLDLRSSSPGFIKIQHLVCSLYKDILNFFPAYARTWFTGLHKGDRAYIDEYTSCHVTNVICSHELDSVSKCKTPSGLTVRARKVSREVVAVYEISDASFEISIELPPNYPLTPVQVNTVNKVGIAATQWRYWILQMTMVLQRQNGTIIDALLLWKEKVDKKLEGVEECMICFSVVHGTNLHSLPKLQCKTCRKKYHAECLYKWFDTSNQSTCPLCRSPMMFK